jgi:methyl-accepting chemotaxis protein
MTTEPAAAPAQPPPPSASSSIIRAARQKLRLGLVGRASATMLLVALLPLALLGGVNLGLQANRANEENDRWMQTRAERISAQVDDWFDKNVRALQVSANLPMVATMHGEDQADVLKTVQRGYPWMYLVFTIGPDGRSVARSDGKPNADYSDRQYFKEIILSEKSVAWETLIGKTSGKPAVVLAVPIRDSAEKVIGVLAAAMSLEDISRILAPWKTGATGFAFVVDDKAKVIAHPREDLVQNQTLLTDHPLI